MRISILRTALDDLEQGWMFYEDCEQGAGSWFLQSLHEDIRQLGQYAGSLHRIVCGFHRVLAVKFPHVIYYKIIGDEVLVFRVLDGRRHPAWIQKQLRRTPR